MNLQQHMFNQQLQQQKFQKTSNDQQIGINSMPADGNIKLGTNPPASMDMNVHQMQLMQRLNPAFQDQANPAFQQHTVQKPQHQEGF